MLLLRTAAAPWILLSILALVSGCSGARDKSKGVTRAQRSGTVPSRGRFTLKDGLQCTWVTKDARDGVKMSVKCEDPRGVTDVRCEYSAKPQSCPGYESNPKGYYKQVSRALKKLQGSLCREERALVKAGMCKRAPRQAHFKLDSNTSVFTGQSGVDPTLSPKGSSTIRSTRKTRTQTAPGVSGTPSDCKGRADHSQVAKEYCSSSWASVCAFFFSMLQSDDC